MDALKIEKAIIGGFDWGARSANIVAALWPERCKALVTVSGYAVPNVAAQKLPLPPEGEHQWWYQYYFATERGALGYDKYRNDFGKLIWRLASPQWAFDDATFDRTATSFNNPDYVAIVIHNYRWRLSLVDGERKYDDLERRIAELPVIAVPTISLEGDANGAPHYPVDAPYRKKYTGKYAYRLIQGGIGHNLPQEPHTPLPKLSLTSTVMHRREPQPDIRNANWRVIMRTTQWKLELYESQKANAKNSGAAIAA